MIPGAGWAASFVRDGRTWREPVVFLDDEQEPWVVGRNGQLCRANGIDGFAGLEPDPPVVAAVPAVGWVARFPDSVAPVVAWVVTADGFTDALVVSDDGPELLSESLKGSTATIEPAAGWPRDGADAHEQQA